MHLLHLQGFVENFNSLLARSLVQNRPVAFEDVEAASMEVPYRSAFIREVCDTLGMSSSSTGSEPVQEELMILRERYHTTMTETKDWLVQHMEWLSQCTTRPNMTAHTLENILSESVDLVEQDMPNHMTYLNHISRPAMAKSVSKLLVVELQAALYTSGVLWEDTNYRRKNELISKVQEKFQQEEDLMEHIK